MKLYTFSIGIKMQNYLIFLCICDIITIVASSRNICKDVFQKLHGGCVMSEILEVIMIVSFGASWPLNVIKSYKARTTKGKSLAFLCLIFFGYIAGIISKLLNEAYMMSFASKWYVLVFYILNLCMVGIDLCLYIRNYRLDKEQSKQ